MLQNIAGEIFALHGNHVHFWQKRNLPGSGLILLRLLRGTFEQEKPKHPSSIMTYVFKEIQAAKNFIVKAVNFLTVRSVQLFLKHQGKRSKRDLWRVGYACREQRDYLKIFAVDETFIFASIVSGSGSQALRMGTTKTAHRQGLVSAVAGPGTVHRS